MRWRDSQALGVAVRHRRTGEVAVVGQTSQFVWIGPRYAGGSYRKEVSSLTSPNERRVELPSGFPPPTLPSGLALLLDRPDGCERDEG